MAASPTLTISAVGAAVDALEAAAVGAVVVAAVAEEAAGATKRDVRPHLHGAKMILLHSGLRSRPQVLETT